MMETHHTNNETESETQPPSLSIDWELYAEYLEDSDLTDDQKREFIETLWNIVLAFVDLGFGIHPVQQACEQNDESRIILPDHLLSSLQDIPENQKEKVAGDGFHYAAAKEES